MAAQSVHRTTADEPDQTGYHEGPTIHFDRPQQEPRPSLHSFPCGPAAPTSRSDVQIAASSKQTQLITGPSLAVGTPCSSRTAVA
jgi:hypothetical protein